MLPCRPGGSSPCLIWLSSPLGPLASPHGRSPAGLLVPRPRRPAPLHGRHYHPGTGSPRTAREPPPASSRPSPPAEIGVQLSMRTTPPTGERRTGSGSMHRLPLRQKQDLDSSPPSPRLPGLRSGPRFVPRDPTGLRMGPALGLTRSQPRRYVLRPSRPRGPPPPHGSCVFLPHGSPVLPGGR